MPNLWDSLGVEGTDKDPWWIIEDKLRHKYLQIKQLEQELVETKILLEERRIDQLAHYNKRDQHFEKCLAAALDLLPRLPKPLKCLTHPDEEEPHMPVIEAYGSLTDLDPVIITPAGSDNDRT